MSEDAKTSMILCSGLEPARIGGQSFIFEFGAIRLRRNPRGHTLSFALREIPRVRRAVPQEASWNGLHASRTCRNPKNLLLTELRFGYIRRSLG